MGRSSQVIHFLYHVGWKVLLFAAICLIVWLIMRLDKPGSGKRRSRGGGVNRAQRRWERKLYKRRR